MRLIVSLCVILCSSMLMAQNSWECASYPDESGFTKRMEPMLERIAEKDFGKRSLAVSKCPDTGLPVKVWAVEGETIISPYTGRAYKQGPTGYFGPKARNKLGEITAFGGDPLKYDLPPATASLILNPQNEEARAFLSIPGNLRQQYHFACSNWARFFPLFSDQMGDAWKTKFYHWVGVYAESRRPSDGGREWLPLASPHNLVGEPGELLGGNPLDGGTENHKTMWRSSALLYSQLFPDTCRISGFPVQQAETMTKDMIRDYLERLLKSGNGEYDSQVYYPYSIDGFLNLHDFSTDQKTRDLAKAILDYYFVTYGLKVIDGFIAGPQKRGYLARGNPGRMENYLWGFFGNTSRDMALATVAIHQATTTYRPNKMIWDIVHKNVKLPFEAKMSRPFYHMDRPHMFAEIYYCSNSFAMGSTQMTIVDNPNQQMVWSLVAEGEDGPLCFSGGHPMRGSTSGHSPYTQVLQSKATLMLVTAPTTRKENADTTVAPTYSKKVRPNLWLLPASEQLAGFESRNRQKYAQADLKALSGIQGDSPKAFAEFFENNQGAACSWFYYPARLDQSLQYYEGLNPRGKKSSMWIFETPQTWIAVKPLTDTSFRVHPTPEIAGKIKGRAGKFFKDYSLLVFPGEVSGFVVEAAEKADFSSGKHFAEKLQNSVQLDQHILKTNSSDHSVQKTVGIEKQSLPADLLLGYRSIGGDTLTMQYRSAGLRCRAKINGRVIDWDKFTNGAVYDSPFLKIKDGKMWVSNGEKAYSMIVKDGRPV